MAEGFKIADAYVEIEAEWDDDRLRRTVERGIRRAEPSTRRSGRSAGSSMLAGMTDAFVGGLKPAMTLGLSGLGGIGSAMSSNPYVAAAGLALGAAIVATAAPAIGAGLAAAIGLGGGLGVLGLGVMLLKEDPAVKAAGTKLMDTLKTTFTSAAAPLIGPFVQSLGKVQSMVTELAPQFRQMFANVAPYVAPLVDGLIGLIKNALPGFNKMLADMGPVFTTLGQQLPIIGQALGQFFASIGGGSQGASLFLKDLLTWLAQTIVITGWVIEWLSKAYVVVRNFFTSIPGWLSAAGAWFGQVGASIGNFVSSVVAWFSALPGRVGDGIASIPARVRSLFLQVFDWATTAIGTGIGTAIRFFIELPGRVSSAISALPGLVRSVFSSALSTATSLASSLVSGVVSYLSGLPSRAASAVSGVAGAVAGALRGAIGSAQSIGANIISGLISGINSMIGAAVEAAKRAVGNIVSGAKAALGIRSPSKVFADQVGRQIPAGIQEGIRQRTPELVRSMRDLVPDMTGALGGVDIKAGGTPAGQVSNVYHVTIDATRMRNWRAIEEMLADLPRTARQFGAGVALVR